MSKLHIFLIILYTSSPFTQHYIFHYEVIPPPDVYITNKNFCRARNSFFSLWWLYHWITIHSYTVVVMPLHTAGERTSWRIYIVIHNNARQADVKILQTYHECFFFFFLSFPIYILLHFPYPHTSQHTHTYIHKYI